ncbi:MAG: hypothetical protein PHQ23_11865 [Candidatus Wallbacteria bacterium]|nr:hypothetical protein [Candidatus Wallbacteria bacterium]
MHRITIITLILITAFNCLAVSSEHIQITLAESAINLVLEKALAGSDLKQPHLTLSSGRFTFEGIYPVSVLIFDIADIPVKFSGTAVASEGDVFLHITAYHQDGVLKDKELTIKRIRSIADGISKACANSNEPRIKASYVPSQSYCGTLKLSLRDFQVLPAIPGLMIRKIQLDERFITVSSSKEKPLNSNAEIQAYIGEKVINALLHKYTRPAGRNLASVQSIGIDFGTDITGLWIGCVMQDGSRCHLELGVKTTLPKPNFVSLQVASQKTDSSLSCEKLISEVVRVVNANIHTQSKQSAEQRMNFAYASGRITFKADFNDIIPLSIRPDIFHLSATDDSVAVFAMIR